MSRNYFIWFFSHDKVKNMEKLSPNCAQLFLRNKYTVFTMGGTVHSPPVCQQKNYRRVTVLQLEIVVLQVFKKIPNSSNSSI